METLVSELGTEEWLKLRMKSVGASEAWKLFDPAAALELWGQKTGRIAPIEPTEAMRWGLRLEDDILDEYEAQGWPEIKETQVYVKHDAYPIHATVDAIDADGFPVECKCINGFRAKDCEFDNEYGIPPEWRIQGTIQAGILGVSAFRIAALVGGNQLKVIGCHFDQGEFSRIVSKALEFWGFVERDEPPPFTGAEPSTLRQVFKPREETYDGDLTTESNVDTLVELRRQNSELEARLKVAESWVLAELRGRTARLSDGRTVGVVTRKRKGYTVQNSEYTQLVIREAKSNGYGA